MNKYLDMLKSGKGPSGGTAKPAKPSLCGFAGFAVPQGDGFSKMHDAAHDPANIPADCVGALRDPDGGLFLPWGPYLSPDDVRRMRAEMVGMIETLADLEHWDAGRRDDVLTRAIRGPLSDLMPNIAHFNERLSEARAEAAAREALDRRTWRCVGLDDRCEEASRRRR